MSFEPCSSEATSKSPSPSSRVAVLRDGAVFVALCISAFSVPLGAQTITLNVSDSVRVLVAPSARLALPVSADLTSAGALNLASLQAGVTWGASQLTFDSIRVAPSSGFMLTSNPASVPSGSLTLNAFSATALAASGPLFNLYFTAGATSGGTRVALTPTVAATDMAQDLLMQLAVRNVDVCVASSGRWGDVTDDGTVNIVDAQQIARFTVGLSVANATALAARGDVTGDGVVNIIDAQQIARFTVALSAAARVNSQWVSAAPVATVVVTPVVDTLVIGQTLGLSAGLQDSTAASVAGCYPVTWASSDSTVATVSGAGVVTAQLPGTAMITATSGVRSTHATVAVPGIVASQVVGPSGGTVVVPGGNVAVTVPAGALSSDATVTVTQSLAKDSTRLDDPNQRLSIRIAASAGSSPVPVTVQWNLAGTLPPEKDLYFLIQSAGQTPTITWPSAAATPTASAVATNARNGRLAKSVRAATSGVSGSALYLSTPTSLSLPVLPGLPGAPDVTTFAFPVVLTTQDATTCAPSYKLSPADGLNSPANDVTVILIHGIQLEKRCAASAGADASIFAKTGQTFGDFYSWDLGKGWETLVAAIRNDPVLQKRANVYIYRYPTTLTPKDNATQLWSLINAPGPVGLGSLIPSQGSILVVGHSMGGLVARYMDSQQAGRLGGIITLGTPHLGTPFATYATTPGGSMVVLPSEGLRSLEPNVVENEVHVANHIARLHALRGGLTCGNGQFLVLPSLWQYFAQLFLNASCVLAPTTDIRSDGVVPTSSALANCTPPGSSSDLNMTCSSAQTDGHYVFHMDLPGDANAITTTIAKLREYLPWVALRPKNIRLSGMVVASVGETLYRIGGCPDYCATNVVEAYDPVHDSWASKAGDGPCDSGSGNCKPGFANGAQVLGGKIYVPGGMNFWGDISDVGVYDPILDQWGTAKSMPHPSSHGASGVIGGKMYVASYGYAPPGSDGLPLSYFQVYDPASNTWDELPPPPHAHFWGAGGAIGGRFYMAGGMDAGVGTAALDVYDPSSGTWTTATASPLPFSRYGHAGVVVNGKLVVAGGVGPSYILDVNAYDPLSDAWTALTPLDDWRVGASLGALGSTIYVIGGLPGPTAFIKSLQVP